MKKKAISIVVVAAFFSLILSGSQSPATQQKNNGILFQYSTLDSLMAGVFDGAMTYGELKQHGDFGIGTFNALDGEMVEVDHQVYQVKSDGVAYPVADTLKAPFAVVTFFAPDQTVKMEDSLDLEQLKSFLDKKLPTLNLPYAIKITGVFTQLQTRSVPRQSPPYKTLAEVLKTQPTFEFHNVKGSMIGFRLPSYMAGANAAGYHFHFLTADRTAGGHVLKCRVQRAMAEIDSIGKWNTVLPSEDAFYKVDLSKNAPSEMKQPVAHP
jgi:acetolactate decarboxylase